MTAPCARIAVCLTLGWFALAPLSIAAEDVDEPAAQESLRLGREHLAAGRHQEALDALSEAWRQLADPSILLEIADCHRALGDHEAAISHYRSYLREVPGADRRRVQRLMDISRRALQAGTEYDEDLDLLADLAEVTVIMLGSEAEPEPAAPEEPEVDLLLSDLAPIVPVDEGAEAGEEPTEAEVAEAAPAGVLDEGDVSDGTLDEPTDAEAEELVDLAPIGAPAEDDVSEGTLDEPTDAEAVELADLAPIAEPIEDDAAAGDAVELADLAPVAQPDDGLAGETHEQNVDLSRIEPVLPVDDHAPEMDETRDQEGGLLAVREPDGPFTPSAGRDEPGLGKTLTRSWWFWTAVGTVAAGTAMTVALSGGDDPIPERSLSIIDTR